MKIATAIAVACLSVAGLAAGQDAEAVMRRYELDIPKQSLDAALRNFAQQTGLQIALFSDTIDGNAVAGPVLGTQSADEALKTLLGPSGLSYKVVTEGTIAVLNPKDPLVSARAGDERKKSFWDRFRISQADSSEKKDRTESQSPHAAEAPAEAGEDKGTSLEEIVVTSQKRSEKLEDVPISMSVLTGRELDRSTVQGVSDALNTVPGVATQQSYLGGGAIMVVRGVAPAFPVISGTSPVAYYLDSMPFGLVKSAIAPDSSPYDLQRVEVLRGPQGTLYGASALNGVVRVLTNDPDLDQMDFKARVSDSYTQYGGNNNRADGAFNLPIVEDKFAARAVVGYQNDDGWIDQPTRKKANWAEVGTYRVKILARPVDNFSIMLFAWGSRADSGAPNVGHEFDKNASLVDQPTSTHYDLYGAKLAYEVHGFSLTSATSYLDYRNTGVLGLDVPAFNVPGSTFFAGTSSKSLTEELTLNSPQNSNWRWSLGGIYRHATESRPFSYTVINAPDEITENISKSYAVFGELTRVLFDGKVALTGGLRHFHDEVSQREQLSPGTPFIPASSTAQANTPRAVITFYPTVRHTLYASYSEGFRSGFPQDAAVAIQGIQPAKPDRLRNYELGSKGSFFDGRVVYDASLYYMRWKDIQQSILVISPFGLYLPAVVNSQSAGGIGSDVALTYLPIQSLALKASVSWNNLEMDEDVLSGGTVLFHNGDRPNASPEKTAGASAEYLRALGARGYQGRWTAAANYTSAQSYRGFGLDGYLVQSGDSMIFTRLSFAIEAPAHWTATLYGDNLSNERGSPVNPYAGVSNWAARVRPRTFGVQFDYHL